MKSSQNSVGLTALVCSFLEAQHSRPAPTGNSKFTWEKGKDKVNSRVIQNYTPQTLVSTNIMSVEHIQS